MSTHSNDFKNGYNFAVEDCMNIIHDIMIERYGTHISAYDLLLKVKNELIKLSFGVTEDE